MPGMSETITLVSPRILFIKLDLPTLGLPTIATGIPEALGAGLILSFFNSDAIRSKTSPIPRPVMLEIGNIFFIPNFLKLSPKSRSLFGESILFTAKTTGFLLLRNFRRTLRSIFSGSSFPSVTNKIKSASLSAYQFGLLALLLAPVGYQK